MTQDTPQASTQDDTQEDTRSLEAIMRDPLHEIIIDLLGLTDYSSDIARAYLGDDGPCVEFKTPEMTRQAGIEYSPFYDTVLLDDAGAITAVQFHIPVCLPPLLARIRQEHEQVEGRQHWPHVFLWFLMPVAYTRTEPDSDNKTPDSLDADKEVQAMLRVLPKMMMAMHHVEATSAALKNANAAPGAMMQ